MAMLRVAAYSECSTVVMCWCEGSSGVIMAKLLYLIGKISI